MVPLPTWMMLPIEPEKAESTKICCGVSQLVPPFVVRVKNVCDLYEREWRMPWSDACVLPPGVTIRSHAAYTWLALVGSAVIDSLSRPFVVSSVKMSVGSRTRQRVVDFETRIALWFGSGLPRKLSEMA